MNKSEQQRQVIAQQAAKLIAENGISDFHTAKLKAAEKLNLGSNAALPNNQEIEVALASYHATFSPDHSELLRQKRQAAIKAMQLLHQFKPRLTGPVLTGTASETSPIEVQLTADTLEDVGRFLLQKDIPNHLYSEELRCGKNRREEYFGYRFQAGNDQIKLTVITRDNHQQRPFDPATGKPAERANIETVETLLNL